MVNNIENAKIVMLTIILPNGKMISSSGFSSDKTLSDLGKTDGCVDSVEDSIRVREYTCSGTFQIESPAVICGYYSSGFTKKRRKLRYRERYFGSFPFYRQIKHELDFVKAKIGKQYTKFNKNVRPKGTHSHYRFYR